MMPWNRLVMIHYFDTGEDEDVLRSEYRYNGLNWRVVKRADMAAALELTQERVMYYSANWQLLEERMTDETDSRELEDYDH